jgi:hypothetical protein
MFDCKVVLRNYVQCGLVLFYLTMSHMVKSDTVLSCRIHEQYYFSNEVNSLLYYNFGVVVLYSLVP